METIVVKIGSESLANFDTSQKVGKMISDIALLMSQKIRIILVSSGAVGEGKKRFPDVKNNAILASVGQHKLIARYGEKFSHHNIEVAQFLPSHAQIEDDLDFRQMFIDTLNGTLDQRILPIVNENDTCSGYEMRALGRGADNDKNALLMARLFHARSIILITNANGVYADFPHAESRLPLLRGSELTDAYICALCREKSMQGTGGMRSKLEIGREGIHTHICNGIITDVLEHSDPNYRGEKGGTVII